MEPLPRRVRLTYLFALSALFIVVAPFAVLYASGYRFEDFSFVPTGGVFVVAPVDDAVVTLNGERVGTTGLFVKSFYVDDLAPGAYVVSVSREGYYPWAKTLIVERSVVTDVAAFMVPEELTITELIVGTTTATSTRGISREAHAELLRAFLPATSTPSVATSGTSTPVDTRNGQGLFIEDGNLLIRWLRNASTTPSGFCIAPSSCTTEFPLESGRDDVTDALFFGLGALYRTDTGGIYYAETDIRPSPLTVKVYGRKGAEFRLVSGALIVKDGKSLFEISGL